MIFNNPNLFVLKALCGSTQQYTAAHGYLRLPITVR